jgi:hypothetical protein
MNMLIIIITVAFAIAFILALVGINNFNNENK